MAGALKIKMKNLILVLTLLSWTSVNATSAGEYEKMAANNQAIKDCLLAYGYDGSVLFEGKNFNWGKASSCYADYKQGVMAEEYVKLKFFLQENPWYKGGNWTWESTARAGYECIEYDHTGVKICRKPYFVN